MRRTGATRADSSASERGPGDDGAQGGHGGEDGSPDGSEGVRGTKGAPRALSGRANGYVVSTGHPVPGFDREPVSAELGPPTGLMRPVGDLDEGDEISVTVGREVFTPVKFQTFDVGPCSATVRLRKGESVRDAMLRASNVARSLFRAEYEEKVSGFLVRVREASETARRGR